MQDWVPGAAVGIVGSFLGWLFGWRVQAAKMEGAQKVREQTTQETESDLRRDLRDFREDTSHRLDGIKEQISLGNERAASQETESRFIAKGLESVIATQQRLAEQVQRHAEILSGHSETLKVLTQGK